jgi:hypothetical protein
MPTNDSMYDSVYDFELISAEPSARFLYDAAVAAD